MDLVWQHETSGDLAWWKLDGYQQVSGAGLTPGNVSETNWKIRGTTDLDGDGQTDLLWQQVASGELSTWFMNGTTLRSGELLVPLAPVTDLLWRLVGPK